MKKILFVANVMGHLRAFHGPYMEWFQKNGWQVDVAANDEKHEQMLFCDTIYHIPIQRSPYRLENLSAYRQLKKLIDENGYDLISCHTPMGSVLARIAAMQVRRRGKTKIIYTCHGFQFLKRGPIRDWLLYYPVELFLSALADCIVTINRDDYNIAKRMLCRNVRYIPGIGVNLEQFFPDQARRIQKREELKIPEDGFVLLSVGELNKNKNHQIVLEALHILKNDKMFYFIAGEGDERAYLEKRISDFNLENRVRLLGFRCDMADLYRAADVLVFPSKREGLAVSGIEAMATGCVIAGSNRRGIRDYVHPNNNGFLCDPEDAAAFAEAIMTLNTKRLLYRMMCKNSILEAQKFSLEYALEKMTAIYKEYM